MLIWGRFDPMVTMEPPKDWTSHHLHLKNSTGYQMLLCNHQPLLSIHHGRMIKRRRILALIDPIGGPLLYTLNRGHLALL